VKIVADVRYFLKKGQKLTNDQIEEIERAKTMPLVIDDDSPDPNPEKNPKLYEALMKAVGERNRKVTGIKMRDREGA